MSGKRIGLACLVVPAILVASTEAAVTPITSVTIERVDNPGGVPNFWLKSITVGGYTVTVDQLVTGTSTGVATAQPAPYNDITAADNFDLNLFAGRATETPPTWEITKLGGRPAWMDTNGNNPDFFLFETGGNQDFAIAAILPGGTVGRSVNVPQSTFGDTGLTITTGGPHNGQTIEGVAFAVTDLLDQNGNHLTNSSVVEGIQIGSEGIDPSCFCASVGPPILKATGPNPPDGAAGVSLPLLQWTKGETAVLHDVYFGTSPELTAENLVASRQPLPMYYHAPGLEPGVTYYWRVDEIEADMVTIYTGDVWSFTALSLTAWGPVPTDGASDVFPTPQLNWQSGQAALQHHLYFGDDLDAVKQGAVETDKGILTETSVGTGLLRSAATYYWRVDEIAVDGTIQEGAIWSFTTAGGGENQIVREWWLGISGTAVNDLTSNPRFPNAPDDREFVNYFEGPTDWADNYGSRLYGWLIPAESGDHTFWMASDDYGELLLSTDEDPANAQRIAHVPGWSDSQEWTKFPEQKSAPIALQADRKYYIEARMKEGTGGDNIAVSWQPPGGQQEVIAAEFVDAFGLRPLTAFGPEPVDGAVDTPQDLTMAWSPGENALAHQVYLGVDADAVAGADTATADVFRGEQPDSTYSTGPLDCGQTYFWRVDEKAADGAIRKGRVWSFTTADFIDVDDFESYTDYIDAGEAIFQTWIDGYEIPANGSIVGNAESPFAEQQIVHGGRQSLSLYYDNSPPATRAEAERTFAPPQDWTLCGFTTLVLYFHGDPANTGQLYLKINGKKVVYDADPAALAKPWWTLWAIDLASVGTNLRSVTELIVGVDGGQGVVYLDDICVLRSAPGTPEEIWLEAEAADTLGTNWTTYDDPTSSAGRHIGSENGAGDDNDLAPAPEWIARYNFTAAGGDYKVLFRVRTDSDSFWVRITDATSQTHEDPDQPGTGWVRFNEIAAGTEWHWDEVHSNDHGNAVVTWTLPAGSHTLEIGKREDGTWLDAIVITNDAQ